MRRSPNQNTPQAPGQTARRASVLDVGLPANKNAQRNQEKLISDVSQATHTHVQPMSYWGHEQGRIQPVTESYSGIEAEISRLGSTYHDRAADCSISRSPMLSILQRRAVKSRLWPQLTINIYPDFSGSYF